MKLLNALSGYQLASGIGCVHLAYLFSMWVFLDHAKPDTDLVIAAITLLQWAHLICSVIAIISWFCEVCKEHFWSSLLSVIFVFVDQAAIFFALYAYFYAVGEEGKTEKVMWLLIEICTFYGFVLAGIVFLLLSATLHFKEQSHVDFSHKHGSDFLEYVKFQYLWFSLYMTLFFTTLFILIFDPEKDCSWPTSYVPFLIVLLVLHAVQVFVTALQNFTEQNLQIETLVVTIPISLFVLVVLIIFYQFTGGCQQSMQLWIKTDIVIFFTSLFNLVGDYLLQSQQQFFKREEYQMMYEKPELEDKREEREEEKDPFGEGRDEKEKLIQKDQKPKPMAMETPRPMLAIRPGFYSISLLGFMKEVKTQKGITLLDSYRNFYNCLFVYGFQLILVMLIGYDIFIVGELQLEPAAYDVFVIRFVCAIILHLRIEGEVRQGLNMLKYVNNHPEEMVVQAAPLAIVFMMITVQVTIEVMNMLIICSQQSILEVFQKFIMLIIITEIDNFYARSLLNLGAGKQKGMIIPIKRSGRDIAFSTRSTGNKVTRVVYRVLRVSYVAFYFYFMAYTVIPLTYFYNRL